MKLVYWIIFLLPAFQLFGQTTLLTVDFESAGSDYTVTGGQTTTSDDWWERTDGTTITPITPFTGKQGTWFFYGEDTDNGRTADDPVYVTLSSVNVTSYSIIQVKILVAAKNDAASGFEQEEYLKIQYAYDGGGFTTRAQFIAPVVDAAYLAEDANADGTTDGSNLSSAFAEFTYSIPVSGSSLQIRIAGNMDQGNEEIAFDYIRIQGDISLPVCMTSFSAHSEEQAINLNWKTESETDNLGFILERAQGNSKWQQIASYQTHTALKGQGNTLTTTVYSYTDATVIAGVEYRYRLGDVNSAGTVTMHSPISVAMTALPQSTEMLNAYPNPFNPETTIKYSLHNTSQVTIAVYDLLGRLVITLIDEQQAAGSYQALWNGTDIYGAKAASGAYIVRMQTQEVTKTQKVLLLK